MPKLKYTSLDNTEKQWKFALFFYLKPRFVVLPKMYIYACLSLSKIIITTTQPIEGHFCFVGINYFVWQYLREQQARVNNFLVKERKIFVELITYIVSWGKFLKSQDKLLYYEMA